MPAQEGNMDDKLSVLRSSTVRCLSQKKLYDIREEVVLQLKDSYSDDARSVIVTDYIEDGTDNDAPALKENSDNEFSKFSDMTYQETHGGVYWKLRDMIAQEDFNNMHDKFSDMSPALEENSDDYKVMSPALGENSDDKVPDEDSDDDMPPPLISFSGEPLDSNGESLDSDGESPINSSITVTAYIESLMYHQKVAEVKEEGKKRKERKAKEEGKKNNS